MVLRLSSFYNDVLSTVLAGFSTASSAVVGATDTVLSALGKLQAQLNLTAPVYNPSFTGGASFSGSVTLSSGSGTNTLTLGGSTSQGWANLYGPAANNRNFVFGTGNTGGLWRRWQWIVTGGTENGTGATANWATNTAFALNVIVNNLNNGNCYQATTGGTSATSGTGPSGTGTGIVDGTVVWKYLGVANTGSDFQFLAWDDANSGNTSCLQITRSSKLVTVSYGLTVGASGITVSSGGGVNFGTQTGASTTDLSKHLNLWGGTYGLAITISRLNYVAPSGGAHKFVVNGADVASLDLNGLNGALGQTTPAASTVTMQNGGPLAGLRNAVMNGNFDIWQRGASIAAVSTGYTADRWCTTFDGTGSVAAITFGALPLNSAMAGMLNAGISGYASYSVSTAGSGGTYRWFYHSIEYVRTFAGQSVTLSFWAWCGSGTFNMAVQCQQYFGTGGSPSATNVVTTSSVTVTTTPTRFSVSFAVPSIVGTTVGTNGNSSLQVLFGMPVNLVQSIGLTGVQLEPGPVATPFEYLPEQMVLAMCQRFCEAVSAGSIQALSNVSMASGYASVTYNYHVPKRATPTFACASWSTSNCGSPALSTVSVDAAVIYAFSAAAGNVQFYNTAPAYISADL